MIDLIFFTFFVGLFYAGFWCGNRYKTVRELGSDALKRFGSLFN